MLADILPKIAGMGKEAIESKWHPRPSSAGPERCARQMVYHGLGVPRDPLPGRAVLVFDDSSWHEELTGDWINKTAYRLHSSQMVVDLPPPMEKGSIDGILTDITGLDYLYEHKAINHFTWQRYAEGKELPLDYFSQMAVYFVGVRKVNPDICCGLLLMKNKNTAQYLEYQVMYDGDSDDLLVHKLITSTGENITLDILLENIVHEACDKFNTCLSYIAAKTLPPRQYDMDHWRCQYCGWQEKCWENYGQEFDELKTDVDLTNEIADTIRYYRELGGQKKNIEKEYKDLQATVKGIMKTAEARSGRAGEYAVELKLIKGSRIDKEEIPPEVLARASKPHTQERLFIKKIKGE
jgi:hypothetical protein